MKKVYLVCSQSDGYNLNIWSIWEDEGDANSDAQRLRDNDQKNSYWVEIATANKPAGENPNDFESGTFIL